MNRPTNQPTDQPTKQSTSQPTNQPTKSQTPRSRVLQKQKGPQPVLRYLIFYRTYRLISTCTATHHLSLPWEFWPSFTYHIHTCLTGLRKTTTNVNQDSWYLGLDSNRAPPKHKSETLILEHRRPHIFHESRNYFQILGTNTDMKQFQSQDPQFQGDL